MRTWNRWNMPTRADNVPYSRFPPSSQHLWPPTVIIANGTVVGLRDNLVDSFLGIPYAQSPTGPLRLKPPKQLAKSFGKIEATTIPRACPPLPAKADPQMLGQLPPAIAQPLMAIFQEPEFVGEDCLTLNIQRPSFATAQSKLPVLVWLYAGGFEQGSTQQADFAHAVRESLQLEHPIIVVQMNWRVSAFGFLAGKELQEDGSTNLGLRDQRLALQWIADNIEAFGGDPSKVVIWGESAGGMSVFDHMIINGGDNTYNGQPLFRGGIMNSGASAPALSSVYDLVVKGAGYCLREIPGIFNEDGVSFFFALSPDEVLHAEPLPVALVPLMSGTEENEGSLFSLALYRAINSASIVKALNNIVPGTPAKVLHEIAAFYANDPSLNVADANELYPGFKRNAAISGDLVFTFQHRAVVSSLAKLTPIWSWVSTYGRDLPFLGTFHGTDILTLAMGQPELIYHNLLQYYISFVYYLDPNVLPRVKGGRKLIEWPRYLHDRKEIIQFTKEGEKLAKDDARSEAFESFFSHMADLRW
ncbi:Alpha/Beta hydrolase protein [Xylogone sp. PMI_703]|nr:Alpha/Beta hydrolase protein [Xylogone sp. PMI_703]